MNFEKFKTLLKENPWLKLPIGMPRFNNDPEDRQKHGWVKHHVEYVAFRPLNQLDLNAGMRRVKETLAFKNVSYAIILHIDGHDEPHSRMRWISKENDEDSPNEHTVELVLDHLCEWHKEYWSPRGHDLVIGYVVKKTITGLKRHEANQSSWAIDIYPLNKIVAAS